MCGRGSGVSKASGGRTSLHFGRVSGSDRGENSEIWAGTRRSVSSNCLSDGRSAPTREAEVAAHQARTQLKLARNTTVASPLAILIVAPVMSVRVVLDLVQRHCIGGVECNSLSR